MLAASPEPSMVTRDPRRVIIRFDRRGSDPLGWSNFDVEASRPRMKVRCGMGWVVMATGRLSSHLVQLRDMYHIPPRPDLQPASAQ